MGYLLLLAESGEFLNVHGKVHLVESPLPFLAGVNSRLAKEESKEVDDVEQGCDGLEDQEDRRPQEGHDKESAESLAAVESLEALRIVETLVEQ